MYRSANVINDSSEYKLSRDREECERERGAAGVSNDASTRLARRIAKELTFRYDGFPERRRGRGGSDAMTFPVV
jgi:hypothetical protein